MVRQINRWGIMDTTGKLLTAPTYYYLSYMGEGLYAAAVRTVRFPRWMRAAVCLTAR